MKLYVGIIILGFIGNIFAQPQSFENIGIKQGLSHSYINCILKDTKGFIWIGTQNGLNRFDGRRIRAFFPVAANARGFATSEIIKIYEDSSGYLWITFIDGGISLFNPFTERFLSIFEPHHLSAQQLEPTVLSVLSMNKDKVWIGTNHGLFIFSHSKNKIESWLRSDGKSGLTNDTINTIHFDSQGGTWLGTNCGLHFKRPGDKSFTAYFNKSYQPGSLSNNRIRAIAEDSQGFVWVGTQMGLHCSRDNVREIARHGLISFNRYLDDTTKANKNIQVINTLLAAPNNDVWVATNGGIVRIHSNPTKSISYFLNTSQHITSLGSNRFFHMALDPIGNMWALSEDPTCGLSKIVVKDSRTEKISSSLQSKIGSIINAIFIDDDGVLWIGLEKGGVLWIDLHQKPFKNYDAAHLPSPNVLSVYAPARESLWVGTDKGLCFINRESGKVLHFVRGTEKAKGIPADMVGVIAPSDDQKIWLGFYDLQICLFDPETHEFQLFPDFPAWSLRSIVPDGHGNTWFGVCSKSLVKKDATTRKFTSIQFLPSQKNNRKENFGFSIVPDTGNILWVATWASGLVRYNTLTGHYRSFMNIPGNNNSLSCSDCRSLYANGKGELWVGTYGGGLNKFDKSDERFVRIPLQAIPGRNILSILPDRHGQLWLGTNRGLTCFNPETFESRTFSVEDGLPSDEFNDNAAFATPWGELLFGTTQGLTSFYPDSILSDTLSTTPCFTSLFVSNREIVVGEKVRNKVILPRGISYIDEIFLGRSKHDFSIGLTSLNFNTSAKDIYRYKLEGYDTEWKETDTEHPYATYSNLPAGTYKLRLRVWRSSFVSDQREAILTIHILPPWWRTWWFKALLLLTIASTGIYFYRRRIRSLKRRTQLLEEQVERRTKSLKEANEKLEVQKNKVIQQKEELIEAEEQKMRFFTSVSHELKTPLTVIAGVSERCLSSQPFNPMESDQVEMIHRNALQLLDLINQLLDIGRIDRQSFLLKVRPINPGQFIGAICKPFAQLADLCNLRFTVNTQSLPEVCWFDPYALQKIVANLVSNAIKYTPDGGSVSVIVSISDTNMEIGVVDTGRGIPTHKIEEIFDRFYQDENQDFRRFESSGIGLSLVKELVQLHHGTIHVQSELNRGSTFTVALPCDPKGYNESEVIYETEDTTGMAHGLNNVPWMYSGTRKESEDISTIEMENDTTPIVLIVEDNADLRTFLSGILADKYRVLMAKNGKEGLEKAVITIPDIIITDIMMSLMDGLEFTKRIKQGIETNHIPVIQLTARGDNHSQVEGFTSGADDYIAKPFNADALLLKIQNILETRRKLQLRLVNFFQTNSIPPIAATPDEVFIQDLSALILSNMAEPGLDGEFLARKLTMGRATLYRKLQALTGTTVNLFIRSIRLRKAKELLTTKQYSVSEVSYIVGFNNHSYFTKCFTDEYGVSPTDFIKSGLPPS